MKKIAEYKDLRFKTDKAFREWLKEKTKYRIRFEDKGQDFLEWWIDSGGEVLHSDLQSWLWNGKIVDTKSLKVGKKVRFSNGTTLKYRIIRVGKLKAEL